MKRECARMFRRLFCLACILAICHQARATVYAPLLHKPYRDKVWWIDSFYHHVVSTKDSAKAFAVTDRLRQEALAAGDRSLQLEADLADAYYRWAHRYGNYEQMLIPFQRLKETARREHCLDIEARALFVIAKTYWRMVQNYELGFEYFLQLDRLLQQTNAYDFPDFTEYYHEIAKSYYVFKDYKTALSYLHKASATRETRFSNNAHWATDNTLGLCFQQLNQLDSSDYYFNKVIRSAYITHHDAYYSIARGNLGYNHYLRQNYSLAVPLLEENLAFALERRDSGLAAGATIPLGDIMVQQGNLDKALELLALARSSIENSRQKERLDQLYPVLCKYYAARGNTSLVSRYLDSTIRFGELMEKKFSALQLLRVQQKMDREQLRAHDEALDLEHRLNQSQRIFFGVMILLLAAIAVLTYYLQRKKHKNRQYLQELKMLKFKSELRKAETQLKQFADSLSEKNELIERLETEDNRRQHTDILAQLRESAILTDEDWIRFRQSFDLVHGDYINNVKMRFPNITPAELRLLVLGRLQFSTKEMATALGISPNSIRVTWHRLRRKLDLPEETSLEALSHSI